MSWRRPKEYGRGWARVALPDGGRVALEVERTRHGPQYLARVTDATGDEITTTHERVATALEEARSILTWRFPDATARQLYEFLAREVSRGALILEKKG